MTEKQLKKMRVRFDIESKIKPRVNPSYRGKFATQVVKHDCPRIKHNKKKVEYSINSMLNYEVEKKSCRKKH